MCSLHEPAAIKSNDLLCADILGCWSVPMVIEACHRRRLMTRRAERRCARSLVRAVREKRRCRPHGQRAGRRMKFSDLDEFDLMSNVCEMMRITHMASSFPTFTNFSSIAERSDVANSVSEERSRTEAVSERAYFSLRSHTVSPISLLCAISDSLCYANLIHFH